jgi:hypothetical protein
MGNNVPLVMGTLSHTEVLPIDQLRGTAPEFVSDNVTFVAAKGTVRGVVVLKPVPGVILSESFGVARKFIRLLPLGAPQPVQRSYPVVAPKFVGLAVLKLFPLVMS